MVPPSYKDALAAGVVAVALVAACADDAGVTSTPPAIGIERTTATPILDPQGAVVGTGWARRPLFGFARDQIPAALADQTREWDFYAIHAPGFAVMITLAEVRFTDLGHFVIASVSIHDFATKQQHGQSLLLQDEGTLLDFLPTPGGNYRVAGTGGTLEYSAGPGARTITFDMSASTAEPDAPIAGRFDIVLPPGDESMALVTPWPAEPGTFFYENKVPALPVSGLVTVGALRYELPAGASFAVMDWVRAVTPHTIDWTWASGVGVVGGRRVGLNLGSVFGDESAGTPDCVIVDGVLHKLPPVAWHFDAEDLTAPWRFTDAGGRVDLTLNTNGYVETQDVDLGFFTTRLRKPHGLWAGTVVLDDGSTLVVDGLLGAAETNHTTW